MLNVAASERVSLNEELLRKLSHESALIRPTLRGSSRST